MTLKEFFEKEKSEKLQLDEYGRQPITDKGTSHDFINGYYNELFSSLKDKEFILLELGIQEGYSMDLWRGFFTKATLHGIDLSWSSTVDRINNHFDNSFAYLCDGYSTEALQLFEDNSLDFIIEDGPHTVPSQIFAVQHWTKKLKPGGILCIEDIQDPNNDCSSIINSISDNKQLVAQVIDLRKNKGRYDDVIVEITKLKL